MFRRQPSPRNETGSRCARVLRIKTRQFRRCPRNGKRDVVKAGIRHCASHGKAPACGTLQRRSGSRARRPACDGHRSGVAKGDADVLSLPVLVQPGAAGSFAHQCARLRAGRGDCQARSKRNTPPEIGNAGDVHRTPPLSRVWLSRRSQYGANAERQGQGEGADEEAENRRTRGAAGRQCRCQALLGTRLVWFFVAIFVAASTFAQDLPLYIGPPVVVTATRIPQKLSMCCSR